MKRGLIGLLCLSMLFPLCACGEKETKRVPKAVAMVYVADSSMDFETGELGFYISDSELEASQQLVEECIEVLKSDRVMSAVAEKYRQRDEVVPLTVEDIRPLFTFETMDSSNSLCITAMCPEGTRTATELACLCKDLLYVAPSIIHQAMEDMVSVQILSLPAVEYVTIEA